MAFRPDGRGVCAVAAVVRGGGRVVHCRLRQCDELFQTRSCRGAENGFSA
jgi:hypothetical protein